MLSIIKVDDLLVATGYLVQHSRLVMAAMKLYYIIYQDYRLTDYLNVWLSGQTWPVSRRRGFESRCVQIFIRFLKKYILEPCSTWRIMFDSVSLHGLVVGSIPTRGDEIFT